MADEELSAGLVERLRDALPGTCRRERCLLPLNSGACCPCADPVLRILGALPIPAAALNALARGEAVVVPRELTPEMVKASERVELPDPYHPSQPAPVFTTFEAEEAHAIYRAMLAASPYANG